MKKTFYVYELIDPRDNSVFYVGKGSGNRIDWHASIIKKGKRSENPYKDRVILAILNAGLQVKTRKVIDGIDEASAYLVEEETTKRYGLRIEGNEGILTNLIHGGAGGSENLKWDAKRLREHSERMKGNVINNGRARSEEAKIKTSIALTESYASGRRDRPDGKVTALYNLGKKRGPDTISKMKYYAANRSPEHNDNISKSLKGNVPWNKGLIGVIKDSEETKQKKREAGHKRRDTQETCEKKRKAMVLIWEKRRAEKNENQ